MAAKKAKKKVQIFPIVNTIIMKAQWLTGGIIEILGDGIRAFQVRKVRLQAALSLIGMALITILVLIYGGLL